MSLKRISWVLACSLSACVSRCDADRNVLTKPDSPAAPEISLSDLRARFAERDQKLASYAVESVSEADGAKASYRFWYRAPQRMRGEIIAPRPMTMSFDGQRLYQVDPVSKSHTVFEVKVSKEKAAVFLQQSFAPFVPEGYRVPLFGNAGAEARKTTHPKAPDAVVLTVKTRDEAGVPISVEYWLRWPSMDFLKKVTRAGGKTTQLTVDEEKCDERTKLCVPQALSQETDGAAQGTTRFTHIELNSPLPNDDFALTAPAGYSTATRELVDAAASP